MSVNNHSLNRAELLVKRATCTQGVGPIGLDGVDIPRAELELVQEFDDSRPEMEVMLSRN